MREGTHETVNDVSKIPPGHVFDRQSVETVIAHKDSLQDRRTRAAWLYYVQVTRLLAEARKRGEVRIRIDADISSIVEIERRFEQRFGINRALVAPTPHEGADPTRAIAFLAGQFISERVKSGMNIGVGWGRTLSASLPYIRGRELQNDGVLSLHGVISMARRFNTAEFSWQFAELFHGEGYLVPAPALVDSPETKHALLERCGISQVFELADNLDVVFLSAGGIEGMNTSYRLGHVTESDRQSLVMAGAVGDLLYNFISQDGTLVDHEMNSRVVSVNLNQLKNTRERVLISGGPEKVRVLLGCMRLLRPTVFISDEVTVKAMLMAAS